MAMVKVVTITVDSSLPRPKLDYDVCYDTVMKGASVVLMFSVCMCARFQSSPRESHLKATKRILRYLKHIQNVGLWYPKEARFELIGYSDSDMRDAKLRERAHRAHVNYWEDHLCLGHQRSKIV